MADFTSIKEAGNAEFKKENWEAARNLYAQALALDSTSEAAGTLYSNRAACHVKAGDYDLALVDAEACIKLRPKWARGWARVGEAQAHLHDFCAGDLAYNRAKTLADDSASRERYAAAAANMQKRMRAIQRDAMSQPGIQIAGAGQMMFWDRLAQEQRQGYVLEPGSAAALALYSYQSSCAGFGELQANLKTLPNGMIIGMKGTQSLHNINESLLSEPIGFILRGGYDQLVTKAIRYQIAAYQIEEAAQVGMSPKDIIAWFERRRGSNWTDTRMPLTNLLKGELIIGFLGTKFGDIGGGLSHYRRAVGLIEEGNRVWPNVDFQDKGTMFSNTFIRASKVLMMQCIEAGHHRSKTSTTKGGSYKLNEIETLALAVIADCEQNPCDGAGVDVGHTAYQIMPHVRALGSLAYVYKERAQTSSGVVKEGAAILPDPEFSRKAADALDKAASLIPNDHPDRPIILYHALSSRLRAGGLKISEIFDRAARAEWAMATPERIFGPTPRTFESRTFVRLQCQGLRDWLKTADAHDRTKHDDPLAATVKPVPTAYAKLKKGDEWVPNSFWLRWPQWNVGLMDVVGR